jgi:AcrR family transcriptional regulator
VPRQTQQELDDEIIETAATLFAQHGFKRTSVQSIADAVGYSKAGLLHRYPSKEALQNAVIGRCLAEMQAIAAQVAGLAPGPERDREVITALVRLAMRRPGFVALLLSLLSTLEHDEASARMKAIGDAVFEAFVVDPSTDLDRSVRVIGALGALSVARLSLRNAPSDLSAHLLAVSYDALGHGRTALD